MVWSPRRFVSCLLVAVASFAADQVTSQEDRQPPALPRRLTPYDAAVDNYINRRVPKISHGSFAADGVHPWQVSLSASSVAEPKDGHFCGATIHNERWLLTAAHCLFKCGAPTDEVCRKDLNKFVALEPDQVVVVAGTNQLREGVVRLNIARAIVHNGFSMGTMNNDIALIELRDPLKFNEKVKAIPLLQPAEESEVLKVPRNLTITGWGATTDFKELHRIASRKLQEGTAKYVTNTSCADRLTKGRFPTTANMICGKAPDAIGDACGGDSGGPAIADAKMPNARQVGIISWGGRCGDENFGRYTRVANYVAWVKQCTSSPDSCPPWKR